MKKMTRKTIIISVVSIMVLALAGSAVYAAANISEVESLYLAFRTAQTEESVDAGDMTQDEADAYLADILENMEDEDSDAVPPLNGKNRSGGFDRSGENDRSERSAGFDRSKSTVDMSIVDTYAELSGMSADEIREACSEDGTSILTLAEEAGLTDELKAAIITNAEASIDQAVEDGVMDADRAEELKASLPDAVDNMLNKTDERPEGFGDRSQKSGYSGKGRTQDAAPQAESEDTV